MDLSMIHCHIVNGCISLGRECACLAAVKLKWCVVPTCPGAAGEPSSVRPQIALDGSQVELK